MSTLLPSDALSTQHPATFSQNITPCMQVSVHIAKYVACGLNVST